MKSFLALAEFHFGLSKGLVTPGGRPEGDASSDDRTRAVVRGDRSQQMGGGYSDEHIRQQMAQQVGQ